MACIPTWLGIAFFSDYTPVGLIFSARGELKIGETWKGVNTWPRKIHHHQDAATLTSEIWCSLEKGTISTAVWALGSQHTCSLLYYWHAGTWYDGLMWRTHTYCCIDFDLDVVTPFVSSCLFFRVLCCLLGFGFCWTRLGYVFCFHHEWILSLIHIWRCRRI